MVLVVPAGPMDRSEVERLLAAYHVSEGVVPDAGRIARAVEQQLSGRFPGILLLAKDREATVGVALAILQPSAELGQVLQVNDFFVEPSMRRRGIGRALATRVLEEAAAIKVDRVSLEVLPANDVAASFWRSLGFSTEGRTVYSRIPPG